MLLMVERACLEEASPTAGRQRYWVCGGSVAAAAAMAAVNSG
jgi:hypothetical protein